MSRAFSQASAGRGATTPNREGRRIAQLFRQVRLSDAMDARTFDLDLILAEDNLVVCESEFEETGYAACLIRTPAMSGIMIAGNQDPGRRRFSLAHELGHYHIPSHQAVGSTLMCADSALRTRSSDAARIEWEANDFATELLMPFRLFSRDVERRDVSFQTVATLSSSDMYNVSLTAAAWRLVETCREVCALVVSIDGKVAWSVRSNSWRLPLPDVGRPVPVGTMAAAVLQGERPISRAEALDPLTWLSSADGRWVASEDLRLFESTHAIPRLNQIISLLWVHES